MAEVFKARMPGAAGFEKILVIKKMLPHLASQQQFVDMFVAEAQLAAQVQHRNVVQVLALEQQDSGEYYMAMEYVPGTDLRQLLAAVVRRNLRLPPWFSIHVVCELLEGLEFAHNLTDAQRRPRNIVHRDVTPANVFISRFGEVKLGDFGVAHDESRQWRTQAGQVKGKIPYMAPEQLRAQGLDRRIDVFAAGVVLWETLTQKRLFAGGPQIDVMNRIIKGERPPPSSRASDIPKALDAVVLKALKVDPDERYPSAGAFQSDLLDVLSELHPRVRPEQVKTVVQAIIGEPSGFPQTETSSTDAPLADPFYHRRPADAVSEDLIIDVEEPVGPERLVADHELRLNDQGAGNAETLTLSSRQLVRVARTEVRRHSNLAQPFGNLLFDLRATQLSANG